MSAVEIYQSDWAEMGLPADQGQNVFSAFFSRTTSGTGIKHRAKSGPKTATARTAEVLRKNADTSFSLDPQADADKTAKIIARSSKFR